MHCRPETVQTAQPGPSAMMQGNSAQAHLQVQLGAHRKSLAPMLGLRLTQRVHLQLQVCDLSLSCCNALRHTIAAELLTLHHAGRDSQLDQP